MIILLIIWFARKEVKKYLKKIKSFCTDFSISILKRNVKYFTYSLVNQSDKKKQIKIDFSSNTDLILSSHLNII